MNEIVKSLIWLFVGAATFLIGMNMMSGGLKKSTGASVKRLFKKTEDNRYIGMAIGASATALIQSSAATSVLAIGFISAGVMTIFQGVSVILGAYIGTTVTGLLVSLSSLNISMYLLLISVVGVVMMFFKKDSIKNIGEVLAGLGILFVGLELMKTAFPTGGQLTTKIQEVFEVVKNPFLLLLFGCIFTALVQSSSATSGIVIVMVGNNAISLASGFYLVLGATIGTVVTTLLASIGGNVNVKRTAFICLIVRIITATIGTIVTIVFENAFSNFFSNTFGTLQFGLAIYLVLYNVIFMFAVSPFLKPIIAFLSKFIKDKDEEKMRKAIKFIDDRLLNTPGIAVDMVRREVVHMLEEAQTNFKLGFQELIKQDFENAENIIEREDRIDYINNRLTDFLIQLSNKVNLKDEEAVGSYFHIVNDIERIGDHANNFHDKAVKMHSDDLKFSDTAIGEFTNMYNIIEQMFEITVRQLESNKITELKQLHELEDTTDKLKLEYSDDHFERIKNNKCHVELSPFYSTFLSELERVADHLVNIGYAFVNPTGDDE